MNFVNLLLCAFLVHFSWGFDSELFLNPFEQSQSNIECCFNRFEHFLNDHNLKQRSVIILSPEPTDNIQMSSIFKEVSRQNYPWSMEIWHLDKYLHSQARFNSIAFEKSSYILLQSDESDQTMKSHIEKIVAHSMINENSLMYSQSICVARDTRNILLKAVGCSLVNLTRNSDICGETTTSLTAAGNESVPFVYYDAFKGSLKGSLIRTIAEKLQLSPVVDINNASQPMNSYPSADMLIGGMPQFKSGSEYYNSSLSYLSDDYTWCVQRAKFLPIWKSFFRIATTEVWLLLVGLGFVNGLVLYFFVQFDTKPEHHKLDLHYTIYLISLPAWIGVSQRFRPNYWPLRIYYMITLVFGMFCFARALFSLLQHGTQKIRADQIHTVAELVEMNFKFVRADLILDNMQKQLLVRSPLLDICHSYNNSLPHFHLFHSSINKNLSTRFPYAMTSTNAWSS